MSFPERLWLVGAGNMGAAMLARWIAAGMDPARVTVVDPGTPAVPDGVTLVDAIPDGAADVVVLAVKPQMLDDIAPALARARPRVLVSILAGTEAAVLARAIPCGTVVRAMPNLPVSLGRGVVALYGDVDGDVRGTIDTLMAPLGVVEWLADETQFHAIIALSGSGPGFVYRFIESMAAGAVALGMAPDRAQRLAIATVEGAAALAGAADVGPATLADRVASKGGTTRAGLNVLDDGDAMKRLMAATMLATARRSEDMAAEAR